MHVYALHSGRVEGQGECWVGDACGTDFEATCNGYRQALLAAWVPMHVTKAALYVNAMKFGARHAGEYSGQHLPVSGVDSAALEAVVSSFYTGQCSVSIDSVVGIHDAACKLEVADLQARGALAALAVPNARARHGLTGTYCHASLFRAQTSCIEYLRSILSIDNCCSLYGTALNIKDAAVMDVCRQYILAA